MVVDVFVTVSSSFTLASLSSFSESPFASVADDVLVFFSSTSSVGFVVSAETSSFVSVSLILL